jgi:D-inositol-3-phosphate glycosyltransferase
VFTLRHDDPDVDGRFTSAGVRFTHIDVGLSGSLTTDEMWQTLPEFVAQVQGDVNRKHTAYDLVHSHYWLSGWVGMQLKERLDVPHVTTFHTLARVKERMKPGHREPAQRKCTERDIAEAADGIIVSTDEERENLEVLYGVQTAKVDVIPPGVDMSLFAPIPMAEARARLGIGAGKMLLFVGRLDPIKGVDILLKAFAMMCASPECRLIIIGGSAGRNDELRKLKALARGLGIFDRVEFNEPVSQDLLPLYYSAADVTVVPSHHESFGLVAVESLACGTPVVASNRGGLRTTIKDGENGLLVDELAPEAFAERLTQILDGRIAARPRMKARESVCSYSWESVADAVLRRYEALSARCGPRCCGPVLS